VLPAHMTPSIAGPLALTSVPIEVSERHQRLL